MCPARDMLLDIISLSTLGSSLNPLQYIYMLILGRVLYAALKSVWKLCTERTVKAEIHTSVRVHTLSKYDICDYRFGLMFMY